APPHPAPRSRDRRLRRPRRPGAGPGPLAAGPAHPVGRALRPGRHHRHHRAHPGGRDVPPARPVHGGGEPARRGGDARHRPGRARRARRLHAGALGHQRHGGRQGPRWRPHPLGPGPRLRARRHRDEHALPHPGAPRPAAPHAGRPRGRSAAAAGRAQLRHLRHRLHAALGHAALPGRRGRWRRHDARALPGRRADRHGRGGRRAAGHGGQPHRGQRQHPQRRPAPAGAHLARARAGLSGHTHLPRTGLPRPGGGRLVRHRGARAHAAPDPGAAGSRRAGSAGSAGGRPPLRRNRDRPGPPGPGRRAALRARGSGGLDAHRPRVRRHDGL
ncbi:MAG: BUG/TctC family periplasmic protein, partial [uncultured Acetobacteraceae bacterium]